MLVCMALVHLPEILPSLRWLRPCAGVGWGAHNGHCLVQDKGVQNAAVQVSGLELGGLLGSLSAGAISDHLVRNNDGSKGNVGLRVQVC